MDVADLRVFLLIGSILGAGMASFALASLVGGAVAAVVDRRGPAGGVAWFLVAIAGFVVGPAVLVGLIIVWDALALGDLPLLYPTWVATALAGAGTRAALGTRLAPG